MSKSKQKQVVFNTIFNDKTRSVEPTHTDQRVAPFRELEKLILKKYGNTKEGIQALKQLDREHGYQRGGYDAEPNKEPGFIIPPHKATKEDIDRLWQMVDLMSTQ